MTSCRWSTVFCHSASLLAIIDFTLPLARVLEIPEDIPDKPSLEPKWVKRTMRKTAPLVAVKIWEELNRIMRLCRVSTR